MVQTLQGTFFCLSFLLFVFRPSWVTPLTSRPLASVSGRCCKACACLCVRVQEGEGVYMGILYVWREGSLVEEVVSHNSRLMSITLIRSPIHQCTQGLIHPQLFQLVDPKSPGQIHTLSHSFWGCVTPSKHLTQMSGQAHRCIHS